MGYWNCKTCGSTNSAGYKNIEKTNELLIRWECSVCSTILNEKDFYLTNEEINSIGLEDTMFHKLIIERHNGEMEWLDKEYDKLESKRKKWENICFVLSFIIGFVLMWFAFPIARFVDGAIVAVVIVAVIIACANGVKLH